MRGVVCLFIEGLYSVVVVVVKVVVIAWLGRRGNLYGVHDKIKCLVNFCKRCNCLFSAVDCFSFVFV